ncbi:MAG: efflux RND transporter periplasmic adaptor subunit [Acidobacteria bacterium]|nr:efflux RND transporter periplasmic adaptor subunit [Acidobacteriota bacterium]
MNKSYWELSRCLTVGLVALAILLPLTAKEGQAQNQGPAEIDFRSQGQTLRFQGQVVAKPDLVVHVRASMWGKIYLEEGIYEGAKVEKDQPLARTVLELPALERLPLEDRTIEITLFLEVAKQKARLALDDYQRAVEISKENPDFQQERDRRQQVYKNAQRELQIVTQQNTRQTGVIKRRDPRTVMVNSPVSGYIDEIYFVPGDINPDGEFRKLFTIIDLSTVWVQAEVYEKDLSAFQNAQEALIVIQAYPDQVYRGRLQAFGSEIDPQSRTISVYYEIPNPDKKLKIGLPVRLSPINDQS